LQHKKDQLVRHPTLGLGKVLTVDGNRVTVFFKDQKENPSRTIVADRLESSDVQSDPFLDNLDHDLAISGKLQSYITREGAIEKFLRKYPTGFTTDPSSAYWKDERGYKWEAHVAWNQILDRATFKELLDAGKYPRDRNAGRSGDQPGEPRLEVREGGTSRRARISSRREGLCHLGVRVPLR